MFNITNTNNKHKLQYNQNNEVIRWMEVNNVSYKYLYEEFELKVIELLNDLINLSEDELHKILRKVRFDRFVVT